MSAPACDCGMFAVATCKECGTSLCGRHLVERDARILCAVCDQREIRARAEREALDAAQEADKEARRRTELLRVLSPLAQAAANTLMETHPDERVPLVTVKPRGVTKVSMDGSSRAICWTDAETDEGHGWRCLLWPRLYARQHDNPYAIKKALAHPTPLVLTEQSRLLWDYDEVALGRPRFYRRALRRAIRVEKDDILAPDLNYGELTADSLQMLTDDLRALGNGRSIEEVLAPRSAVMRAALKEIYQPCPDY